MREQERRVLAKRPEVVSVTTITDGMENQSREDCRADILNLVDQKQSTGWTFAFLGAGLDAYGEAAGIGYDPRSV